MNIHTSLLIILIFIVINLSIQLNVAENCVFEYPFQWDVKLPKCHPYDYCLAFDEHRWQNIQFATKTAYRLNEKSTTQNHFDVESECNCFIYSFKSTYKTYIYFVSQFRLYTIENMVINSARDKVTNFQGNQTI